MTPTQSSLCQRSSDAAVARGTDIPSARIGTTTFAFRYLLLTEDRAPELEVVARAAGKLGLEVLQICEKARPMLLDERRWRALVRNAATGGLEIQLGCKTLSPDVD